MRITDVVEVSKARYKISLDHTVAFVLYKGDLSVYQIRVGNELREEQYREILDQVLDKRAKLRALNLLKARPYTEYCLRRKLREGFYPEEIIDRAIEYVKQFRYVDDARYCMDYIEYHQATESRRRMRQKMQEKGISGELFDHVYSCIPETYEEPERIQIEAFLSKRHYSECMDAKEKNKLMQSLLRKGYPFELIRHCMKISGEEFRNSDME